MVAPTVFLATYSQSVLGLAPVAAGFVVSIWTLSWPVSAPLSQHVYRRIGFRNTALPGIAAAAALLFAFPFLVYPGEAWQPMLLMLLLGAGLGLLRLPLIIGVQSSVDCSKRGTATASIVFRRQTGQTLGNGGLRRGRERGAGVPARRSGRHWTPSPTPSTPARPQNPSAARSRTRSTPCTCDSARHP